MIATRFYERGGEVLLAACDEELLGKTFRSDGMKLTVSKTFYSKDTMTEDEFRQAITEAVILNLVGNRTVSIAIEKGFVSKSSVLMIEGVEHAQVVRM